MNRTLIIARSEFLAIVRTKAFIIGVLMAPLMIGLSIAFQVFAARRSDVADHAMAVIDRTGLLYEAIARASDEHNAKAGDGKTRTGPHFLVQQVAATGTDLSGLKADLSNQVRDKKLFAFVEIPADVFSPAGPDGGQVEYYTETPSYESLPDWLHDVVEKAVREHRFRTASVDPALVAQLTKSTRLSTLGLLERRADGSVSAARRVNGLQTVAVPFGLMYLLFIALMTAAPQLLTAVVEEKMSRISEVLIASVSPFQLMAGKLLGVAAVAVVLALVYFGGVLYAAMSAGQFDLIRPALMGWFLIFLLCAVVIYGSVFLAIGAACSDSKDAQSMMPPVMIVLVLPMLAASVILRDPQSALAVGASLVPVWTPMLMLMRLALTPAPPFWQVGLSIVLTLATAAFFVWAASRVFRIGLLMQGKPPNLPELLRWIWQ